MAKKSDAKEPAKPARDTLQIDRRYVRDDELAQAKNASDDEIAALTDKITVRAVTMPSVRAARIIQRYDGDALNINACADELQQQIAEVQRGDLKRPEAMLIAQAHTLDALFQNLALRSHSNSREGYLDAADRYMRLAFKAQAQAVRTIEALGELKNPRPVAFVKQANIAHGPQQVNNGVQAGNSIAHGENTFQSNKLSGATNELLPDARASQTAGRVDTSLEAVGEINRAAN